MFLIILISALANANMKIGSDTYSVQHVGDFKVCEVLKIDQNGKRFRIALGPMDDLTILPKKVQDACSEEWDPFLKVKNKLYLEKSRIIK